VRWITRCAWCGRYRLRETWIDVWLSDAFAAKKRVTHSICPECIAGLEDARRSEATS
jgi:hypothetical protein